MLRTPLAEEGIVTARVAATNAYEPDERWVHQLGLTGTSQGETLRERIASFSKDYDDITRRLLRWIRASRSAEGAEHLFGYAIKQGYVRAIASAVTPAMSLETFVEMVLAGMRATLEQLLPAARHGVGEIAKGEATALLLALQEDVHRLCKEAGGQDTKPFDTVVSKVRTEMQNEYDRVADWFQPPPSTLAEPFTLEVAAQVAVRSVQTVLPGLTVETRSSGTGVEWSGRAAQLLPHVVDVLFPALQNAAQYGDNGPARRPVELHLEHADDQTMISVKNAIRHGTELASLDATIARLQQQQRDGSYQEVVAAEGGTGLHKLFGHLNSLFGTEIVEFWREGDTFNVRFAISPPAILK